MADKSEWKVIGVDALTMIRVLVDDAMRKRDRSINLYLTPDGDLSVYIQPWSEEEWEDDE